jgi:hypothetical protein
MAPQLDPNLRYDKLRTPYMGHVLVDIVNERFNNRYDFSGGMSFETEEDMKKTAVFYDTLASDEDKEIDKWTGFPKNQYTYDEMAEKESTFPTWEEIATYYQEYVEEYNSYEGKRQRVYPHHTQQLDMIFHAIDSGLFGEDAKTSDFYQTLKTIKEENS